MKSSNTTNSKYGALEILLIVSMILIFIDVQSSLTKSANEFVDSILQMPLRYEVTGWYFSRVIPHTKIGGVVFFIAFSFFLTLRTIVDKNKRRMRRKKKDYKQYAWNYLLLIIIFCCFGVEFFRPFSILHVAVVVVAPILMIILSPFFGIYFREIMGWDKGLESENQDLVHFDMGNSKSEEDNVYSFEIIPINPPPVPKKKRYINVTNIAQGLLVSAGAGAGKSFSVINPILAQAIQSGYTGLVYDFKFPTLACVVQGNFNKLKKDRGVIPYYVNFDDLTRSHRCNPVSPQVIDNKILLKDYVKAIIKNLNPSAKEDFWQQNAEAYLQGVLWWLKNHEPEYCTLPHAISMILSSYQDVLPILKQDNEVREIILPILSAFDLKAESQLAGVFSSVQLPLEKLNTKEISWVLSGDDFSFDLNNPDHPKFLTIGNNPITQSALSPVLSLIATVVATNINQQDKLPSIYCLDEAPTLYIPNLDNLPATARSNKVGTVVGIQDFAQLEKMYKKEEARALVSNLGNQFYGMTSDNQTARSVSEMFGKKSVQKISNSENDSSETINYNHEQRDIVPASYLSDQDLGCFVGKTTEKGNKKFRAKILASPPTEADIPQISEVSQELIDINFQLIKNDIEKIIAKYKIPNPASTAEHNKRPSSGTPVKNTSEVKNL